MNKYVWSENKTIESVINILLFLFSVNFIHLGQLLLPLMCLLVFISNNYRFKVNNNCIFILLCTFAFSFFAFSYKLGFYCVMGFCLPMAYYIGSNIKNYSEENIKKIIYIIAFGMIAHVFLNVLYTYSLLGNDMINTQGHYDIWTKTKLAGTSTAVNYIFIIGCIYYNIFYEKNSVLKVVTNIIFTLAIIYNLFLGRRTPVFVLLISFVIVSIIDLFIYKKSKRAFKIFICIFALVVILTIIAVIWYKNNSDNTKLGLILKHSLLFKKFKYEGLSSGRFEILIDTLKLMPYHLWGGEEISYILNIKPHDLLLDTYNYAGIIPFLLLTICSIYCIYVVIMKITHNINKEFNLLLIPLFVSIVLQMMLEPVMTGSSLFLIAVVMIVGVVDKYNER